MPKQVNGQTPITLTLPFSFVQAVATILQEGPYKIAAPILNEIQRQLDAFLAEEAATPAPPVVLPGQE